MELGPSDTGVATAARIDSLSAAFALFARFWSPRTMAVGLVLAVAARFLVVGPALSGWDLAAVLIVAALVPLVEWSVHLVVLHARPRTVGPVLIGRVLIGRVLIDPGAGHREHHLNPASVNRVLLRGIDASLFQLTNAGVVVVVVGGPLWLLDIDPAGPVLTGIAVAILGLVHYEWSHFLFHTAYRPKTRYYRRLKANHRLHHWRNENHWLGVTTNAGDRLMRTYPKSRSAVPLSPTARTLGIDPQPPEPDPPSTGR